MYFLRRLDNFAVAFALKSRGNIKTVSNITESQLDSISELRLLLSYIRILTKKYGVGESKALS